MGNLIDLYGKDDLDRVTGKSIYDLVKDGIQFDVLERLPDDPPTVTVTMSTVEKMLVLKSILEYKWFLPIHYRWKYRQLVFHGYSAYTLLKLIEPHQRFHARKRRQMEALIEDADDCPTTAYAAGAIERSPDKGRGFREKLKKAMEFTKVRVISPCDFEYNNECGDQKTLFEHGDENDLLTSYKHCRVVIEGDVGAVVETESVIALIDQYIGTGTKSELTVAVAFKRPVYAIMSGDVDIKKLHPWTRSCVSRYFESMEELTAFIKQSEV